MHIPNSPLLGCVQTVEGVPAPGQQGLQALGHLAGWLCRQHLLHLVHLLQVLVCCSPGGWATAAAGVVVAAAGAAGGTGVGGPVVAGMGAVGVGGRAAASGAAAGTAGAAGDAGAGWGVGSGPPSPGWAALHSWGPAGCGSPAAPASLYVPRGTAVSGSGDQARSCQQLLLSTHRPLRGWSSTPYTPRANSQQREASNTPIFPHRACILPAQWSEHTRSWDLFTKNETELVKWKRLMNGHGQIYTLEWLTHSRAEGLEGGVVCISILLTPQSCCEHSAPPTSISLVAI